jgi:cephalosporin-C deacetylase-like acetyl esterase
MKTNPELWPEDTSLRRKIIGIEFRGNEFLGHMVAPSEASGPRPLVVVIHNYPGPKGFRCRRCRIPCPGGLRWIGNRHVWERRARR